MIKNNPLILFLLTPAIFLFACGGGNQLASLDFEDNCWGIADSLVFDLPSVNIASNGNPEIVIKFLHDYPDRNLFLKVMTTSPSGEISEKILEDVLFDSEGNWLRSGENDAFVLSRPIELDMADEGIYKVKITQFTRREQLCDIKSVKVIQ